MSMTEAEWDKDATHLSGRVDRSFIDDNKVADLTCIKLLDRYVPMVADRFRLHLGTLRIVSFYGNPLTDKGLEPLFNVLLGAHICTLWTCSTAS